MEPLRLTPRDVSDRTDQGEDFVFVDARSRRAWQEASDKVPGAVRVPPDGPEEHLADLPTGKPIVAYCT
jgi:hypothetical protein